MPVYPGAICHTALPKGHAIVWYRKAAEQGLVEAQKTLNVLSEKKPELPGNHVKELFHFTPSKPDSSEKDFPSEKATEFPNSKR